MHRSGTEVLSEKFLSWRVKLLMCYYIGTLLFMLLSPYVWTVQKPSKKDHVTPILMTLHWLPICFRIDFLRFYSTFKALKVTLKNFQFSLIMATPVDKGGSVLPEGRLHYPWGTAGSAVKSWSPGRLQLDWTTCLFPAAVWKMNSDEVINLTYAVKQSAHL